MCWHRKDEQPQQRTPTCRRTRISKYLITNAQYDRVRAGRRATRRSVGAHCWTSAGLKWRGDRSEPEKVRRRLRPAEPSGGER